MVGWSHTAGNVSSPKQDKDEKETATILHRFHFSSALKRMSAIVRVDSSQSLLPEDNGSLALFFR